MFWYRRAIEPEMALVCGGFSLLLGTARVGSRSGMIEKFVS